MTDYKSLVTTLLVERQNRLQLLQQNAAMYREGRTGGVSGTVHGPKKQRITNHGYQNFIFPNHENQHVTHCFILFLRTEKCPRSV